MKKETKKAPTIRFRGFTENWEQRKFGNLFSFLQNNTLSRSALDNENGRIQTVHYGDVLIKFGECLDVTKEILPFIRDDSIAEKYKDSFLQNGDIIIADTAEDETVGKCTEIVNLSNQKIIAGLHTMPVRSNENFAAGYLGFYLNSDSFHNQLKPLMQGTKVTSISKRAIQDTVVKYPLALEEQQEIGKYFLNLDNLITLHQRKFDQLKTAKKYFLQNMFPAKGEKVPRIRFQGFTGEWEQRKFGEIAEYKKGPFGSALKKEFFIPDSDISIKVYEQQNAINKDWTLSRYYISQEYAQKLKAFEVHSGDIIVSCAGTIGEIYELPAQSRPGIINQALMRIRVNKDIVCKDIFKLAFSNMIDSLSREFSNGSAIKNIPPFADLKPMKVLLPDKTEQKLIGDFFTDIDKTITLHQRKLNQFQTMKKFMLQNLFI